MATIRVALPYQLYTLARCDREIALELAGAATLSAALDALEAAHPMLAGAVRDRVSGQRRPLIRFFACQGDWSNRAPEALLPDAIVAGHEPLLIVGAIAGG
jgi:hypothetical protein